MHFIQDYYARHHDYVQMVTALAVARRYHIPPDSECLYIPYTPAVITAILSYYGSH